MKQEDTLFRMLAIIQRIVTPTLKEGDLPSLQRDVHAALTMFERDFPLSMQVSNMYFINQLFLESLGIHFVLNVTYILLMLL